MGGKLTTYRLMGERTADAVCLALGVDTPSTAATTQLETRRWALAVIASPRPSLSVTA